jgi:hypothetical protein
MLKIKRDFIGVGKKWFQRLEGWRKGFFLFLGGYGCIIVVFHEIKDSIVINMKVWFTNIILLQQFNK